MRAWTEDEITVLLENLDKKTYREIGEILNRPRESVKKKANRLKKQGITTAQSSGSHVQPEFPDLPDVNQVSLDEYLEHIQGIQTFRQKESPVINSAKIRIPTNGKPIAICFTSCWHMGGLYTFYKGFKEKLDEVLEVDRFYWGVHGDETEHFPPNWASTVFNNLVPPSQQKRLVAKIIHKLHTNGRLLYSMWSNHPAFEERVTGEHPMELIYKDKVPYFAGKGIVKLTVDKEEYVLSVAHNFKGHSQWNPNHAQRKQFDNVPQADVIASGHLHRYSYQELDSKIEAFDAGLQNNAIVHLIQTGTAKTLKDPYTIRWWRRGTLIWPTLVFSAKEHKIHRVYDRTALEWYLNREDF